MATITRTVQLIQALKFVDGTQVYAVSGEAIHFANSWDDISDDVLGIKKFSHNRGVYGILPTNCVATPGSFNLSLKNDASNSAGKVGYYSFNHANVRPGFEKGAEVRVRYVYSGTTTYHWRGRIADVLPSPDPNKPFVDVICYDWMLEAQEQKLKEIQVTTSQRVDQGIQTMLNILPNGKLPAETSLDVGISTLPVLFDSERDEKTTIIQVMQKMAQSELGQIFVNAGSSGEQLVFHNRHHAATESVVQYDFDDSISEIATSYPSNLLKTVVQVVVYPREYDESDVVLGQLQKSFSVGAGADRDITLLYRDPNGNSRISTNELAARVSGTDYSATANEDGSGGDRTSGMVVTVVSQSGNSIKLNIANTSDVLFWVQVTQQKGKGIYLFDPLQYESRSSEDKITRYGERLLRFDMPYEDNYNMAVNIADYLKEVWQELICSVTGLAYYPERSAALAQAFVDIDIGKRITINLPQVGLDQDYFVRSITISYNEDKIRCEYGVAPAEASTWLVLDDIIFAVLDSNYAKLAI